MLDALLERWSLRMPVGGPWCHAGHPGSVLDGAARRHGSGKQIVSRRLVWADWHDRLDWLLGLPLAFFRHR
jgi:hypothetical protein